MEERIVTEVVVHCDHCGRVLDPFTEYAGVELDIGHRHYQKDLCVGCFDNLIKMVEEYLIK